MGPDRAGPGPAGPGRRRGGPGSRRRGRASRPRRSGRAPRRGPARAPRPAGRTTTSRFAPARSMSPPTAPARSSAGSARGCVDLGADDPGIGQRRARGQGAHDAGHILVGHRPDDERERRRLGLAAAGQERTEVVEGPGQDRGTGRVVGTVEEDLVARRRSISSSRPGQRASRSPAGGHPGSTVAIPASARASRIASATATLAAWCRPRSPTRVSPEAGQLDLDPVTVEAEEWRPAAPAGAGRRPARPAAGSPPGRRRDAPVTARSPRMMIAAFSRAIALTVEPSRSMWSRSTLVIAATPPSQAWVASSRPPRPTSTTARSTASSANQRNATAVSSSNSVGSPWRRATRSAAATACLDDRREGRPARPGDRRSGAARGR